MPKKRTNPFPEFTDKFLRDLAGERSFQRGKDYFADGRVEDLVLHGGELRTTVFGTEDYLVTFAVKGSELTFFCDCPYGQEGHFCKHCVATALAWREAGGRAGKPDHDSEVITLDELRPWLESQSPEDLASMLLDAAADHELLREKLLRRAAKGMGRGIDWNALKKSLERATRTGGFVDYREAWGFADGVREAIEPLKELLQDDPDAHGEAVLTLTEFALKRMERAMGEADDSDGSIGLVFEELQTLHLDACKSARLDPEALAKRLFDWEMATDWDTFYNAFETYGELLGKKGRLRYRNLAEATWDSVPAIGPGEDRQSFEGNRFRLSSIMEAIARDSGDVEAVVAVKAKDLSSPYSYLQIAELYWEAKQVDCAIDWAVRGLKDFPQEKDSRLVEFLAHAYHHKRRHAEAMDLVWDLFVARPDIEEYTRLLKHAKRARARNAWRRRALQHLEDKAERDPERKRTSRMWWSSGYTQETLVRIHLSEKHVAAAWQAATEKPLSSRALNLELARARAKTHPADAIPLLVADVEASIDRKNNGAYDEAVTRLLEIKKLYLKTKDKTGWVTLLERLRLQHKAKRNFVARASKL